MQLYNKDNLKHISQIAMTTITRTVSHGSDVIQISCWRQIQPMGKGGSYSLVRRDKHTE